MHLKNLQVVGFKSFADKIKLDFEPGLTAVVGPNGCGKSNIIDAFRWCLGEMSAKSLRSNLMLDVIFNGSGSRPPQNMSEVTLIFDNSDKKLPIDYPDVAISRRLFRSGESEYFINKVQCRLRDIRELFLDTGMGEDGYSSMEQGKVEWVLQAKPEQRRELFEEAAGVSKYRARREEAVRKLEKVEIDLSRLNDIISVTSDQIRKLENAVTRAKTYERIRGELKTLEIEHWLFQLNQIDSDLERSQQELEGLKNRFEELNTQTHQSDADLAELRRKMTETEEELLAANSALATIESDIKVGEERLQYAKQRMEDLSQQRSQFQQSIQQEEARIQELQEKEAQQKESLAQFQASGHDIEETYTRVKETCDQALAALDKKRDDIKAKREQIFQESQERAQLQQKIAQCTSDTSRLESQCENASKEKARVEEEINQQISNKKSLEEAQSEQKNHLSQKNTELEQVTTQLADLKREEESHQNQIMTLSQSIAKLEGQIHSIHEQEQQDPYLAGTKAILNSGLPGVYGPVGRLFQCTEQDRDIISASLGEHLGDLVADNLETAQRAIEYLTSESKGRGRIWILEKIPTVTESDSLSQIPSSDMLINRIQCEDRFRPLLKYLGSNTWIQGATVYGVAAINGGVDPSRWQTHVSMRLPELDANLRSKKKNKDQAEVDLKNLVEKIQDISGRKENLVKELEERRIRLEVSQEEITKLEQRTDLLGDELKAVIQDLTQFQEEKAKAELTLEADQKTFDDLQKKETEAHSELDALQQDLTEQQNVHAQAHADLSTKQEQYNSYREKLNWHESVLDHTRKETEAIEDRIAHHKSSIEQSENEMENTKNVQAEAQGLIGASLEKRNTAADRCSAIQAVRVELTEKVRASEEALEQLREALNSTQETLQNKRVNEIQLKDKFETFIQKLADQYEMNLEQAKESFTPKEADLEILDKLKKRVSNMGPINLAAPQEHAELVEKNGFLTTQRDDLIKAKEDLRQVISKINATTREHFRETFEKVQNNFRMLYSELFRGGEADLQLTNESDILSSGIDIYCQPPGKKLLHISLLSGGEKALTACALLFAFFLVRPSPVALLDEVDAPLDEANVVRFVEMVKKFSEKTQFLMITHNKRTMEAANNLYGVTMEEFGVSKVLSARLQKEKTKEESKVGSEKEPATA